MTKADINKSIYSLKEEADRIIERSKKWSFFGLLLIFAPYFVVSLFSVYLVFWLLRNHFLDFLLFFSPNVQVTLFFTILYGVVIIFCIASGVLLVLGVPWVMRKYHKFPTYEEIIFALCTGMAVNLMTDERLEAKKKVSTLVNFLTNYVRDLLNPKRKVY